MAISANGMVKSASGLADCTKQQRQKFPFAKCELRTLNVRPSDDARSVRPGSRDQEAKIRRERVYPYRKRKYANSHVVSLLTLLRPFASKVPGSTGPDLAEAERRIWKSLLIKMELSRTTQKVYAGSVVVIFDAKGVDLQIVVAWALRHDQDDSVLPLSSLSQSIHQFFFILAALTVDNILSLVRLA